MEYNIGTLPDLVLARIFSFLNWRDKLNFSSTCKHFMNAMNYRPHLFEDVCVKIVSFNLESGFEIFSTPVRNFCYFSFECVNFTVTIFNFIKKIAPRLRRLHFIFVEMSDDDVEMFRGKIENCNNLWELKLLLSRAFMLFSHLPQLRTLNINTAMSSLEMPHIQTMAPTTLTDFSIERTNMESGTLYQLLDDFIRKRCRTLQSLNLGMNKMKSEDLVKLSRIEGLNLRRVILPEFYGLEEGDLPGFPVFQSIISFCNNQRTIVDLDMTCALDLDDATLAIVCDNLPQIEGLSFHFLRKVDRSLSKIFQLKRLRRLKICENYCVTSDSYLKSLNGFLCHNLKYLELSYTNIDDEIMSRLLPLVTNLRELTIHFCSEITDLTLFAISWWLKSLRVLDFFFLPGITNDGLLGSAKGSGTPQVPLSSIKGLQVLKLCSCKQLTEDGLIEAIRFEHLVELDLTHSGNITESGRKALIEANSQLRTLRPAIFSI